jgi:hypothetical protein
MPDGVVVWAKWGLKAGNGSKKWFVICPKLKNVTFTKMEEMFDCCLSSQ